MGLSGAIWACLGPAWCYLGLSGSVWNQSGANLGLSGAILASLGLSGTNLVRAIWGQYGTNLALSGTIWTFVGLSGTHLIGPCTTCTQNTLENVEPRNLYTRKQRVSYGLCAANT